MNPDGVQFPCLESFGDFLTFRFASFKHLYLPNNQVSEPWAEIVLTAALSEAKLISIWPSNQNQGHLDSEHSMSVCLTDDSEQ